MKKQTFKFTTASTNIYFEHSFSNLKKIIDAKQTVIITDENVFALHQNKFKPYNTIVIKAGEKYKIQTTVDSIIEQLIQFKADRKTLLLGVGGGMVLDITGYAASIYMRGLQFAFVPTTLLALIDASIGGKNGINTKEYKNMVGTIKQPLFIFHDLSFLKTLAITEWQQGFAEIIKHACIKDATMFKLLQKHSLAFFTTHKKELSKLIQQNVLLKIKTVQKDEFEQGERKLLNFGHTIGHAIEMQYELSHGQAIAIGITYAAELSEKIIGFKQKSEVVNIVEQYGLPTYAVFDKQKIFKHIKIDKKKEQEIINFILLHKIGKAVIQPISLKTLEQHIQLL
ncbi:MAG: 3-dehydroquinate synthase [Chitinophagaceae bacterium]|nr:3-dehydroquinate synthase [Chitinophagaceae bacterium]MCW5905968.1 3-dehydroquinate synthase [Chitinophagaceae bacterium]